MRSLFFLLPLLGALTLAQDLQNDKCVCPQVKCLANDPVALCKCLNSRERNCKRRCPKYKPTYTPCPVKPTPTPNSTSALAPQPSSCVCEETFCLQSWPQSCYCANDAAQRCYDKCGGKKPESPSCESAEIIARAPEPKPEPELEVDTAARCECLLVNCIQQWPESCHCANDAAKRCHKRCGGKKPKLNKCPPGTSILTTTTKSPKPTTTSSAPPQPTKTHKVCGGGRANSMLCDEGYTCISDPYTPGCGLACDGLGICVKDKMCGGFAGFKCDEEGQVCLDDPRDDCDPTQGGADCGGLCVWPHEPLHE